MYGKFILCLLVGVLTVSSQARGNVLRGIGKQGKAAVSADRSLKKVVSSSRIAREGLRLHPSSVGIGNYAQKVRRFQTLDKLRLTPIVERIGAARWVRPPLDGFTVGFTANKMDVAREAAHLEQLFGKSAKFKGVFCATFEEVRALSFQAVQDGTDAAAALENAAAEGGRLRDGFLTVAIAGNSFRPKDVLIYSPQSKSWISLNQSKARYLAQDLLALRQSFRSENKYWAECLDRQGVVIRPDNYAVPHIVRVSLDGVTWQEFDISSQTGSDLWKAWNEGFYIAYDRHSHTARFALSKESAGFSSFDNLIAARAAKEANITVLEDMNGNLVYLFNGADYPNMSVRLESGELASMSMARLTAGKDFPMPPVEFIKQLQELSLSLLTKDPSRRMIFLEDTASKGDFYDVEDCVLYLSKDGSFSLPGLDDVQFLESIK